MIQIKFLIKNYLLASFIFCCSIYNYECNAQASCTNIDFEMGNFTGWTGNTGYCCPVVTPNNGIVTGRHTIMSGPGFDPNTCGTVPVVYPGGGTYSARLGNDGSSSQAERLTYTFLVSPNSSLFIYRYAVVLEDPAHNPTEQPRFEIKVLNSLGTVIDPVCGFYSVVASGTIPGFQSCGSIRYKNWTTVGIDLSLFIGQNISIEFSTGDCGLGAHFGYAYIEAFCSPLQITGSFCSNSTTPAVLTAPEGFTYQWSTGETSQDIIVVNPTPGSVYSVVITSVTGCQATLSTQLFATVVNADFNVTSYCQKNVTFVDNSTFINEAISNWDWDFGDGETSTDKNPIHAYASSGTFDVRLITTTPSGCKDTTNNLIDVIENPVAEFLTNGPCIGVPLNITNTSSISTSTISSYLWNDGNGNIYTDPVPAIGYAIPGTYTIDLLVTAANGCTDSATTTNTIRGIDAAFSSLDDCLGVPTNFIDNSNAYSDIILSWDWNFGNGVTGTTQNPDITYTHSGAYRVSLDIISNVGCSSRMTSTVNIFPLPLPEFSSGADSKYCSGDQILFYNQSLIASGTISSMAWDFGDGIGNSTDIHPFYNYADSGTYFVNLITVSDHNCVDSIEKPVSIYNYPTARFSADSVLGCQPLATLFTDSSTNLANSGATWAWDFGDGNSSNEQYPMHVYNEPGIYDVSLVVSNQSICFGRENKKDMITVLSRPESDFIMDPEETTIYLPDINFYERSIMATSWRWDFGDHTADEGPVARHRYDDPGNYHVMLISENDNGCLDTSRKVVRIRPEFSIFAPTAFSPNGDGINDKFEVTGLGIEIFSLVILDRWGKEIFVSNNLNDHWNGAFKNAGTPSQNDVYVWRVRALDVYGEDHELMGRVSLIK